MNPIDINLYLAFFGTIVTLVTIRGIRIITKLIGYDYRYMKLIMVCNLFYMLSVMVDSGISGMPGAAVHTIMLIANTMEYLGLYLVCCSVTCYLLYLLRKAGKRKFPMHRILVFYLIPITLLIVSCFNKMYFYIGEDNCYHVGEYFILSQILGALAMIFNAILLVRFRTSFKKDERLLFTFTIVVPTVAVCIQAGKSVKFMVIATTFCCLALLLMLLGRSRAEYAQKLLELEQVRSGMTYTQLNPHFLYNALSAISVLCKKDPDKGSMLADQVSEFLRKSSDDMRNLNLHSFEEEFEHTRNYLEIEQVRYGEDLQAIYDIRDTDFKMPGFVFQQLVELLIHYEFVKMDDIMTISISSANIRNEHVIRIISNGEGPMEQQSGRPRVLWTREPDPADPQYPELMAIEKIRTRLSAIPEATLKAETYNRKGTVFTIVIPDKGDK